MRKSAYGIYDASRKWYLKVKSELLKLGMKPVDGDAAFFTLRKDDQLVGLTILHVDDFLLAGTPEF